jgi:hypothetical protein
MGTKLQRVASAGPSLPVRRSDASEDKFVREHMAKGEALVRATKYTQSTASCVAQIAIIGVPAGLLAGTVAGPLVAGLMIGGFATAVLGFEVTNRVALTDSSLVLQSSVLVRRFDRSRIENPRVEVLSFRHWARFDVHLLDPTYFFRRAPGLRFEYRKPNGKVSKVFVGVDDADRLLAALR